LKIVGDDNKIVSKKPEFILDSLGLTELFIPKEHFEEIFKPFL
jgi:hypothetical protein